MSANRKGDFRTLHLGIQKTPHATVSKVLRRPICDVRSLQENLKEQILFFIEKSLAMKMSAGLNRKHVW